MKKTLLMIALMSGMNLIDAAVGPSKLAAPTSGLFTPVVGGTVSTLKPTVGTTIKIVGPEQPLRQYGGDDLEYMNRQYQSATGMTR